MNMQKLWKISSIINDNEFKNIRNIYMLEVGAIKVIVRKIL